MMAQGLVLRVAAGSGAWTLCLSDESEGVLNHASAGRASSLFLPRNLESQMLSFPGRNAVGVSVVCRV